LSDAIKRAQEYAAALRRQRAAENLRALQNPPEPIRTAPPKTPVRDDAEPPR